ncbi:hypothetical protein AAF712_005611 [Marasmius tenuissimus]|uniref:Uncharacterized protein n=1 Tax=Marasmius tenuissimus TaxID=585030 RepID=A0ABR3A0A5_9AGAR
MPDPVTLTVIEGAANAFTILHLGRKVFKALPIRSIFKTKATTIAAMETRMEHIRDLFHECRLALNYGGASSGSPSDLSAVNEGETRFQTLYKKYLRLKRQLEEMTGQEVPQTEDIARCTSLRPVGSLFSTISQEIKDLKIMIKGLERDVEVLSISAQKNREDLKLESEVMKSDALFAELGDSRQRLGPLSTSEQILQVRTIAIKYIDEKEAELFALQYCKTFKTADPNAPVRVPQLATPSDPPNSSGWDTPNTYISTPRGAEEIQLAVVTERLQNSGLGNRLDPDSFADPKNRRES